MLPRELEADGKQIGSLNDCELQSQLCLCTELEARRQTASLSSCPKQRGLTKGHDPGHPTRILFDLVRGGRLPLREVISLQGARRVMELCKAP